MTRSFARRTTMVLAVALVVASMLGIAPGPGSSPAGAAPVPLVPDVPRTGYPVIEYSGQYQVFAANQVGSHILSGGDFQQVTLQNGTTISQPYFTAWHIDTKQIACTDTLFNGIVLDIIPGNTPNTAFVSGKFSRVTGPDGVEHVRSKLVKINLPDCSVDVTFDVTSTWGKVSELALHGNRLFAGGDFTQINGNTIRYLAELDANTGDVNPAFDLNVTTGLTTVFRGLGVNPEGTRLIAGGRWSTISGVSTGPTAVIDISDPAAPSLTGHRSSGMVGSHDLQDANISPDGTKIALVYGTATVSDYVYLVHATESPVSYTWRHYMRDSNFGVGLTNEIVYVGGHFCKIDTGPGATAVMAPNGLDSCTGVFFAGGAWRTQLAALDINTGTPLTWNPGNDAFRGASEITVTPRGLLVGYDGRRTNHILVGPLAFFDLGAANQDTTPPSSATITAPDPGAEELSPVTISATATDDTGVVSYDVRIQHSGGQWVQPDGSLSANEHNFAVVADGNGDLAGSFDIDVLGGYTVQVRAVDAAGNVSTGWSTRSFTVTDGQIPLECTAVVHADGTADLTWDAAPGDPTYQVRRNGGWIAGVTTTSYTAGGSDLADEFVIRYWQGGPNDIECDNEAGDPLPQFDCTAASVPGGVLLSWDAVPGITTYQVRVDGTWLASVTGLTHTHTGGDLGDDHVIRYWQNGPNDITCTP